MDEIIRILKDKLLNKKVKLIDLDRTIIAELGSNSLFEEDDCIKQKKCIYYIYKNKYNPKSQYIIVSWEIIKQEKNNLHTIVKVNSIDISL